MRETTSAGGGRDQGLSAICANGCAVLALVVPTAVAAFWAFGSWSLLALVRLLPPDVLEDMPAVVLPWQRVAGALICLVPALLVSYGLLRARRSLAAFVRGDFFGADVVTGLRDYAAASFWAAVAAILSVPVLSVVITHANAAGHRELSLDLSGAQVPNLLGAGILWVIASAMARAAGIARENAQFV
jgi:hypothetical protein